jgi:hypothetical protein
MIGAIASQYVGANLAEILEIRNDNGQTERLTIQNQSLPILEEMAT